MNKDNVQAPMTLTVAEAAHRHKGVNREKLAMMCLQGEELLSRYRRQDNIPAKEMKEALFAKKIGRCWHIPVTELDRVFLGKESGKAA